MKAELLAQVPLPAKNQAKNRPLVPNSCTGIPGTFTLFHSTNLLIQNFRQRVFFPNTSYDEGKKKKKETSPQNFSRKRKKIDPPRIFAPGWYLQWRASPLFRKENSCGETKGKVSKTVSLASQYFPGENTPTGGIPSSRLLAPTHHH